MARRDDGTSTQINLRVPASFKTAVTVLQKLKGYRSQTEAIRIAVEDAARRAQEEARRVSARSLLGVARDPDPGRKPRFETNAELWDKDRDH